MVEILDGKAPATVDELQKLYEALSEEIAKVQQANRDRRLEPGPPPADPDVMQRLERQLAKNERDDLARHLRPVRVETDKDLAIRTLSSSGDPPPGEMLKLAKRLAGYTEFGLARRVLDRVRPAVEPSHRNYHEFFQKNALYTYKDPDLPLEWRLDRALEILSKGDDLARTESQETCGLAGAIFKRKWEADGQRHNLERSLFYYLRGYAFGVRPEHVQADTDEQRPAAGAPRAIESARADVLGYLRDHPGCVLWADEDRGYCGVNAAFVLDLLAAAEEDEARRAGMSSGTARERHDSARAIREEILRSVPALLEKKGNRWLADEWWFYATIGEACFGLGTYEPDRYRQAITWLVERPRDAGLKLHVGSGAAAGMDVPEWEYESTARQLARLARLHGDAAISEAEFEKTEPGKALAEFLQNDQAALRSAFQGRFGLALSGGGFRASLFHIGVLARLAELDVLRHIEVLSCVSGGSIIGTQYYLELRHLLETKTDDKITREDYVHIVKRIERLFLAGVQRNIRTRVLAEWTTNLKMIFSPGYSRTLRVGELYERELFASVEDSRDDKGCPRRPVEGPAWLPDGMARRLGFRREPRWLNKLFIHPLDKNTKQQQDFRPRRHNWRRRNKAPVLILNTACLNTGHNWQFTASYMGEPPTPINEDIDSNYRLRRMYYDDAPARYRNIRLGHAVAASSCVPGLFEPLVFEGLYPSDDRLKEEHRINVRLIDGGVCDNQGVASLLEQDCTVILVSDASGQMDVQNTPAGGPLGVLMRSNSLLQARVRETQYVDVTARRRSALLRGLMFVHLRQDLPGENMAWRDCPSYRMESDFERKRYAKSFATPYHVASSVQRRLAAIRTDLDSFHDAEAYALMASAYYMTEKQFSGEKKRIEGFRAGERVSWLFLAVHPAMEPVRPDDPRLKHLERLLGVGASAAFKIWKLSRPLIAIKWAAVATALVALVWLFVSRRDEAMVPSAVYAWMTSALTFERVGGAIVSFATVAVLARVVYGVVGKRRGLYVMRVIRWQDTARNIVVGLGMALAGFLVARLHLHVFDRLYLWYGKLERFPGGV
jgi:predicted acylesterase/phospholipase RssA